MCPPTNLPLPSHGLSDGQWELSCDKGPRWELQEELSGCLIVSVPSNSLADNFMQGERFLSEVKERNDWDPTSLKIKEILISQC